NGETLAELFLCPQISETSPTPPPPELRRCHCDTKRKTGLLLFFEFMQVIRDVSVDRIIYFSDLACIENTRMDRCAFHALCNMLKRVGRLEQSRNMGVKEMVPMFLHIIAHDVKIRVIKRQFVRSEETISRRFND
ncbi:hypothetical protein HN51_018421, partial [Arachis hypogaea]